MKSNSVQAVPMCSPVDPTPMETTVPVPVDSVVRETIPSPEVIVVELKVTKKKKKKASYKSMMAAMTQGNKDIDIEKEKESLRKVTGGGAFIKVDKI
eukprot:CAMPEP_0197825554 /NCGR_PEP_ID=MMETSP1437-20131217/2601_1 /TAXON_ID=49252 ORGANISM="Eucampia antarctica, Strain CCMP1452" /NCGR_SAMPLE_ID=MMETSP1437 /ASSEMBLY_ACC=CAM_ASM_001096 /LENGTH=96 /DNA_ID=CAMNT_0043425581 /DNA_START=277 /DNA_END=567 /DNA_ORIENTATION=+